MAPLECESHINLGLRGRRARFGGDKRRQRTLWPAHIWPGRVPRMRPGAARADIESGGKWRRKESSARAFWLALKERLDWCGSGERPLAASGARATITTRMAHLLELASNDIVDYFLLGLQIPNKSNMQLYVTYCSPLIVYWSTRAARGRSGQQHQQLGGHSRLVSSR